MVTKEDINNRRTTWFTAIQHEVLMKRGYLSWTLTGRNMEQLRDKWQIAYADDPPKGLHLGVHSMATEVAFLPSLYLPNSNNTSYEQQVRLIEEFSRNLQEQVPGVVAVMGNLLDYIDLARMQYFSTRVKLFGRDYGFGYARAIQPYDTSLSSMVGNSEKSPSMLIKDCPKDYQGNELYAVPLMVPRDAISQIVYSK